MIPKIESANIALTISGLVTPKLTLASAGISVDTIVQNSSIERIADVTFTISKEHLQEALAIVKPLAESIKAKDCFGSGNLGNVSIVGTGMQHYPGYASLMFRSLFEAGVNIEMITTSEIRITCIISESRADEAVRVLHQAFELEMG